MPAFVFFVRAALQASARRLEDRHRRAPWVFREFRYGPTTIAASDRLCDRRPARRARKQLRLVRRLMDPIPRAACASTGAGRGGLPSHSMPEHRRSAFPAKRLGFDEGAQRSGAEPSARMPVKEQVLKRHALFLAGHRKPDRVGCSGGRPLDYVSSTG